MATGDQLAAISLYRELMEEAKARVDSIARAINCSFPAPLIREYCYLQLRMTCEVIAFGCLTTHGDIEASRTAKLRKQYSPEKILKALEALHPNFYPVPVTKAAADPPIAFTLVPFESGFLTKADLPILVGKCGDVLHRGSVKKLLNSQLSAERNFEDVDEWARKISVLLNIHLFHLFDGQTKYICQMNTNEGVQVAIAGPRE